LMNLLGSQFSSWLAIKLQGGPRMRLLDTDFDDYQRPFSDCKGDVIPSIEEPEGVHQGE